MQPSATTALWHSSAMPHQEGEDSRKQSAEMKEAEHAWLMDDSFSFREDRASRTSASSLSALSLALVSASVVRACCSSSCDAARSALRLAASSSRDSMSLCNLSDCESNLHVARTGSRGVDTGNLYRITMHAVGNWTWHMQQKSVLDGPPCVVIRHRGNKYDAKCKASPPLIEIAPDTWVPRG